MRLPRLLGTLLPILTGCGSPAGPSAGRPPTGVIYFEYLTVSPSNIAHTAAWQVHPDGTDFRRVPHPFLSVRTPHVGLSGRWLAYVESGDVFVADLTNPPGWPELPHKDITFVGRRSSPLVSPSGSLVANTYSGPDIDRRGIRISRNDQSGVETLLTPPSRETSASDRDLRDRGIRQCCPFAERALCGGRRERRRDSGK